MMPANRLLKWYRTHGRRLPWRETRHPYKILVSEIMLQQTQVHRVLLFYSRWLERFPNWHALAIASRADVLRLWAGLGYNRRALMLQEIARQVVAHGEPTTEEGWRALKGIGAYTAAAISAFAQKKRTLPIDTNIRRVLARILFGVPFPSLGIDARIRKAREAFLPRRGRFYDVPQAIFDLAASHCTKNPGCAACPMKQFCKAAPKFLTGSVRVPRAMIKKAKESRHRNKPFPDRIYRGRILKLAREAAQPIPIHQIGPQADPDFDQTYDQDWIRSMVVRMHDDHLVLFARGLISLP